MDQQHTEMTTSQAPPDPVAEAPRSDRPKRRSFTAQYKRDIVAEYDQAPVGEKGKVLRREGLFDSHVLEWRAKIAAGTLDAPPRRGRPARSPEQARIVELERQVTRLEADLARREATIAARDEALDVLGKGVAFLEALSSRNAR